MLLVSASLSSVQMVAMSICTVLSKAAMTISQATIFNSKLAKITQHLNTVLAQMRAKISHHPRQATKITSTQSTSSHHSKHSSEVVQAASRFTCRSKLWKDLV